ncbi:MAG: tRNA (guanosine(37)-N1)-methyltransferase TrmD [candidate division WOR-3 bacterium]|nr:MAG: tRNA (guanosine(37)-N1)-methyltransferase TrmD [candidate division WOR-3 bacterium]
MQVHIISLFPEYFTGPFDCGPTRIAREKNSLSIDLVNPRDFTDDAHRTVDDYPFGGGAGMVLKPEPLFRAVESVQTEGAHVVLLSARGRRFNQQLAQRYSQTRHLILVCGRYKDVDERVRAGLVDEEVSIGDFVTAGGEPAAVVIVDAFARLLPGVVEHEESVSTDSFAPGRNLLDAPWYTRPRVFRGMPVPEVLVSGDHAAVEKWRRRQSLLLTARRRPELLQNEVLSESEREFLMLHIKEELSNGQEESH